MAVAKKKRMDEELPAAGLPSDEVKELPVELLAVDPMNIRAEPKIDDDFRNSVAAGIIHPLTVRPVECVESELREKLKSEGKKFVVTVGARRFEAACQAGLETVPCIVKELNDTDAMCLSIAENKHRKDIPPYRWVEVIKDLYSRFEGTREQRYRKMVEKTGIGESTIREYLLLAEHLTPDFVARLKEPEERSFSEKELLAERAVPPSEEKAPIGEISKEMAPLELPRVPQQVMVKLVQDKDFRELMKKDPAKAHELATEAAAKGQHKVGEVLRKIRERPKRERVELHPVTQPVELSLKLTFPWDVLESLNKYMQEKGYESAAEAVNSILLDWFRKETNVDYVDLQAALEAIVAEFLETKGYMKKEEVRTHEN
jgi:ParB/RepB/Spo0J family partition protein